jgi:endonuclease/exonuclease/phosphatase family metal-dependent hydrolase
MVVRSWNLFHGNTSPPGRKAYLREMVELVTADAPAVVCLQEVPLWALERVGAWAGMDGVADRARRARLPGLARRVTALDAGLLRSSLTGQGHVILVRRGTTVREHKTITLNTNPFCEEEGRKLGLDAKLTRWWERERRICQVVKLEFPSRRRVLVAYIHATSYPRDPRLPDAELRRATSFVDRQSEVGEVVVVAGDFNVTAAQSETMKALFASKDVRWSAAGPAIDHVLVHGADTTAPRVWPDDDRRYGGRLLSDHAPVELDIEVVLDATPQT